jgi:hypothetical protein
MHPLGLPSYSLSHRGIPSCRCLAPVRSASLSLSRSGALPPTSPSTAGAWGSRETVEAHLLDVSPLGACCRSCHSSTPCALHRMLSEPSVLPHALQRTEQALLLGRPHWLMGRAKRVTGLCQAGRVMHRLGREGCCWPGARAQFRPGGPRIQEIPFPFFWISLDCFKLQKIISLCSELQKL